MLTAARMAERFGILTFQSGPFAEIVAQWRAAESVGFDVAYVVDTMSLPGLVDYEAWTTLAALARETSRIRIGTLVTILPFRHPALLAAQAITLDHLSAGRLELGIGAGGEAGDMASVGLDPWPVGELVDRLEDQVRLLDGLMRGERIVARSRFYGATDLQLAVPVQRPRPPLIVAAQGPRTIAIAARLADGWSSLGGQPVRPAATIPLEAAAKRTKEQNAMLDAACEAIGRDPRSVRRSVLTFRTERDPLSSLDAFDEFTGVYREAGIEEFIFNWPPIAQLRRREAVPRTQQAMFERIGAERLGAARAS